jgi:hypothetical protein
MESQRQLSARLRSLLVCGIVAGGLGALAVLVLAACAAPPPQAADTRDVVFVVMLDQKPVAGAAIYANGAPLADVATGEFITGGDGRLTARVADDESVVALQQAALFTTTRPAHAWLAEPLRSFAAAGDQPNWKYQVLLTSMAWNEAGIVPAEPVGASRIVTLTLSRQRPLILFNLLVSIEWDAHQGYVEDLDLAMRRASGYLWDLTDGQMALGQVRIVDNRENWWEADIQILARNTTKPHASIDGIERNLNPQNYRIQLSPYWNRRGAMDPGSPWSEQDGFRTIVHELGHYALGLYDEYIGPDGASHACTTRQPDACFDSTGASAMNYQYTTSELSAHNVADLWSDACENTLQWFNTTGESAWQTVARRFSAPDAWEIVAPRRVMPGPQPGAWPIALPPLPIVDPAVGSYDQAQLAPYTVTVSSPVTMPTTSVWLRSTSAPCDVSLGTVSAAQPWLWVRGSHPGDRLIVETLKPGFTSTWLCGDLIENAAAGQSGSMALTERLGGCQIAPNSCHQTAPSGSPASLRTTLDPSRPLTPSDIAFGPFQAFDFAFIPFSAQQALARDLGLVADLEDALNTNAVGAVLANSAQGNAPAGSVQVCFPDIMNCQPLDIGVAANAMFALASGEPSDPSVRQTLASNDGLLQIFQHGSGIPADLLIVDSPLPLGLSASHSQLVAVSRLYTLGGNWSNAELLVQIQADCCAGDGEGLPRLYRIEDESPVLIEDSWYADQEGYVLATIRQPGAYALFRP